MKKILFFIFCLFYVSNVFGLQTTYDIETDTKRTIFNAIIANDTELYSDVATLDSDKLESTDIDTLTELNTILSDATLIDSSTISDSTSIGLDTGASYTNFGSADDDTINEMFSAINTKFGTLAGGHDPISIGTANGLSLVDQVISLGLASTTANGAISSAWITFLQSIDTESEFKALYNLEAGTDFYSPTAVDTLLANKLNITSIDDIPVDGVINAPISSNWAYDHENASDPHSVYATDVDVSNLQTDDLNTLSGVSIGSTDLGTFTGTTIQDNRNNKEAFQDLETEVETKLDSFTTLSQLNTIVTDATLINRSDIADSNAISLVNGSGYTSYGSTSDDTLNELFLAIDTAIGGLGGGHDPVTIGTANGLSLATQVISLALATNSSNGAISSAWIQFLESIDTEAEFKASYNLEPGTDFYSVSAVDTAISNLQTDDLNTLSGVIIGSTDLGTFTGSTIADNRNNKEAFQDLETEVETKNDAFTNLSELNAFLSDATLIDDGDIGDSILIGLTTGDNYTNFGVITDDSLNEMFAAIDTAIGNINDHDSVTIGTANGLSLSGQEISLALGTNSSNGAVSSTWITFLESIDTESELKTSYNLEIGTDIQAQNDYLSDISGLTPTQYYLLGWDGSSNVVNISEINDSIIPSTITRDTELTDGSVDADFNSVTTVSLNIAGTDGDRTVVINCNTNAQGFTPTAGETGFACVEDVSNNPVLYFYEDGGSLQEIGSGSGDSISIDSVSVTDPDFVSTGDIDFVDTSNTITANINTGSIETTEINATTLITSSEIGGTASDTEIPTWKAAKDYADSVAAGAPTIQASVPTANDTTGEYFAISTGHKYYVRNATDVWDISAGTQTLYYLLTVSDPGNNNYIQSTDTFIDIGNGATSGTYYYASAATPELTATAASGYEFLAWTGDYTGSTNPYTLSAMSSDFSIGASFNQLPTVTSFTVDGSNGTMVFSEAVTQGAGWLDTLFNIDGSVMGDNIDIDYVSGNTTNTWQFTLDAAATSGETINLDFPTTANAVEDANGGDLQAITDFSVTNNTAGAAYQQTETFDGSSQCYSGGTSNCDNTDLFSSNDGVVLNSTNGIPDGTNQMEFDTNGDDIRWDLSGFSEGASGKYLTYRMRIDVTTENDWNTIYGFDASANTLFTISVDGNNTDAIFANFEGTFPGYCSTAIAADTNYYIRIKYLADTGTNNAELEYCTSSDGATWTDCVSSTVDSTFGALTQVRWINNDTTASQVMWIDTIKADDEEITDATAD